MLHQREGFEVFRMARLLSKQLRTIILPAGIVLVLLFSLLLASGCGNSTKTTIPKPPDNPFEMARVGTDSTLEVMTWNLEQFAKSGNITAEQVIQAIEALNVDIIGLQEIHSPTYFQAVVDGLEGWTGFKANSAGYDIDLAFLYREDDHLQFESIMEIMTNEWRPFPRRPLLFLGSFNGRPIAVINNHLKCCGNGTINENDSGDEETRRRDACLLLEDFVITNLSDRSVFLVGDFNDELTDDMDNNVFANFLGDPDQWRAADMAIAEGHSSGWSFPGWPSHLDHILIDQSLFAAADGADAEVHVIPLHSFLPQGWNQYDEEISDHLPVVLKLGL